MRDKIGNKVPFTTVPNSVLKDSATNNKQRILFDIYVEIFKNKRKSKQYPKEWELENEGFYPTTRAQKRTGIEREEIGRTIKKLAKEGKLEYEMRKKEYKCKDGRIYHRDTYYIIFPFLPPKVEDKEV